jgi:hypothetical protein
MYFQIKKSDFGRFYSRAVYYLQNCHPTTKIYRNLAVEIKKTYILHSCLYMQCCLLQHIECPT